MIRKNFLFCKLGLNNNAFDLYTKEMDHYTPQNEICPTCGAKGCCKIHGHYRRFITDRIQDQAIDHPVDIVRVRCKSCGHTHSILPDGFIPYDPYSLPFVLHVLMRYFSHEMNIQLICARFQISVSTLYRWIHIFYRHRQEWLGILNDIKMLMNYGYDSVNCFTLILCGESHLNSILTRPVNEALRQRITVHYNYAGLSDIESAAYIVHKLSCAGSSKSIIEEAAIDAVSSQAHGNPRLIDNIMSDALAIGTQLEKKCIDTDVILAAVYNQDL